MKDRKKSPLVNEEFIKERYKSGNPLTAEEIQGMFKDAFRCLKIVSSLKLKKSLVIQSMITRTNRQAIPETDTPKRT